MYRAQISDIKNQKVLVQYEIAQKKIELNVKLLCVDLIRCNAMEKLLQQRLIDAETLENSSILLFEKGEYNMLELNKAKLNRLNAENMLDLIIIDKQAALERLKSLNGNKDILFTDTVFPMIKDINDFENWYLITKENIPELKVLKYNTEMNKTIERLSFAESLPKLEAGYMSEKVSDEQFQGVTLGITLPLWENKNKSKYAKLITEVSINEEKDREQAYYSQLKEIHNKLIALQENVSKYEATLNESNNSALLLKALDIGEISLINYLTELMFYYESMNKLSEMKTELCKSYFELMQYSK